MVFCSLSLRPFFSLTSSGLVSRGGCNHFGSNVESRSRDQSSVDRVSNVGIGFLHRLRPEIPADQYERAAKCLTCRLCSLLTEQSYNDLRLE